jgi:hypothetical protein
VEPARDLRVDPLLLGDGPAQARVDLEGIGMLRPRDQRAYERR